MSGVINGVRAATLPVAALAYGKNQAIYSIGIGFSY